MHAHKRRCTQVNLYQYQNLPRILFNEKCSKTFEVPIRHKVVNVYLPNNIYITYILIHSKSEKDGK